MDKPKKKYGRKSYVNVLEKGLKYITKRRNGEIKSLITPWPSLNEAGINGLEWGSMLTIGARPGAGKTMIVSQILREARRLNPDQKFNILEFQFEMGDEQYAARQFAGEMAQDYGVILSTKKQLDDFTLKNITKYIEDCKDMETHGLSRDVISESLTHTDMEEAIQEAYVEGGSKPMIVTIDHSWLIKKRLDEKEKIATLYNTTEMLMKLKNKIPIIVIMITQLNRSIDEASRKTPGTIANYPTSGDIFGGDALMQGSDLVIALSRPAKADVKVYGPYAYQVENEDVFMHLLKIRNGNDDNKLVFLKMDGQRQQMVEVPEFKALRPEGATSAYQRYSERTGGGGRRNVTAEVGEEL